jgi:hypothetical protein
MTMRVAYICLPAPQVGKQYLYLSSDKVRDAQKYFQNLVNLYGITVKDQLELGRGGCQFFSNTIYVPRIKDASDFLLCLHEVGHMVHGPTFRNIVDEFKAEQFAISHGRRFGLNTAEYEKHAKRYVFTFVAQEHLLGLLWAELEDEARSIITNWLGITEIEWSTKRLELTPASS